MSFRRSVATGAFVAVVALSSALPAGAQGFGGGPPPYSPEPGAKDLKSVLYNWTWHMGMLRGQAEPELVGTLEYQGEGTVQVNGQPCTLTKFRISANYQTPGYRNADRVQALERPDVLEHRNDERAVRVGRGHSGRGNHRRPRQGDAPVRRARGADDPSVGEPSWRAESRDRGRGGRAALGVVRPEPRRRCSTVRLRPV